MATQASLLVRLTRAAVSRPAAESITFRLCRALVEISEMDGAALSVGRAGPHRSTLLATDEVIARIEDVQDTLREGPSLDVERLGEPVLIAGEDLGRRWPLLMQSLSGVDVARVVALPVRPARPVLGVVTLYARDDRWMPLALDELQFLVNAIGTAVAGSIARVEDEPTLWSTRDLVSQATGMVIAQLGLGPDDALAVLRAHAYAHDLSVAELSQQLIDRAFDFRSEADDPDRPDGTHEIDPDESEER